jgi:hypothetical protein
MTPSPRKPKELQFIVAKGFSSPAAAEGHLRHELPNHRIVKTWRSEGKIWMEVRGPWPVGRKGKVKVQK